MHQGLRPGPDRDPGRFQVAQQAGRHVLVVEGDDVAAGREGAYGLRVGVVADGDVVHHGRRGDVGPLGQQPHPDAQADRRRIHHPGELSAADDADREAREQRSLGRSVPARPWSERTGRTLPQPEDQRALHDEVHRGGHALGDHERDHLDRQPGRPWAVSQVNSTLNSPTCRAKVSA